VALIATLAIPCTSAQFDLSWWSVDGGGGSSAGGDFTLVGTVGQPDAGLLSGDSFTLQGGFLPGGGVWITSNLVIQHILGLITLTGSALEAANANGVGPVDAADIVTLVNMER
jgi:hypothetical protein